MSSLAAVWKRVVGTARPRPALRPLPREPGGDRGAARRPRHLPARLRRAHRVRARPAAGARGPAGVARASEAEVRSDAAATCSTAGRAARTSWRPSTRRRRPSPSSSGACAAAGERYASAAGGLSSRRRRRARDFAKALEGELASWRWAARASRSGSTTARSPKTGGRPRGIDVAEFFVSPNPGEDVRPLARIASGGELSRLMLALKTLATTDSPGKTLVFDEVDAGIGGRVADVVGQRLQALGRVFQVLCITHLPQIAACGHSHYRVAKAERAGRTHTTVEALWGPAPGRRTGPHDGRRRRDRRAPGPRRGRCSPPGTAKANQRRKAKVDTRRKAKGESESRWPGDT